MEFYCNSNFYGNKCYGVGAASKYYFGKKCADLEPHEAAMLIGLSNSPASYNPVLHPKAALKKRNSVLRIMCKEGVITPKEYKSALKKKLNIKLCYELCYPLCSHITYGKRKFQVSICI